MAAWAYGKIGQWLAQRQRLMRVERLCTTTFFLCKVQTLPFLLGQISNMFLIKVKALLWDFSPNKVDFKTKAVGEGAHSSKISKFIKQKVYKGNIGRDST